MSLDRRFVNTKKAPSPNVILTPGGGLCVLLPKTRISMGWTLSAYSSVIDIAL